MKDAEGCMKSIAQAVKILFVTHAVGQVNVETGRRLHGGVIVELVNGQRKHGRVVSENAGGAVAVMYVAIDYHGALDEAVALHAADGYGDVVDGAETLAVSREGMIDRKS